MLIFKAQNEKYLMTIVNQKKLVAQTGNEYSNLLVCNTVMVTVLVCC